MVLEENYNGANGLVDRYQGTSTRQFSLEAKVLFSS